MSKGSSFHTKEQCTKKEYQKALSLTDYKIE